MNTDGHQQPDPYQPAPGQPTMDLPVTAARDWIAVANRWVYLPAPASPTDKHGGWFRNGIKCDGHPCPLTLDAAVDAIPSGVAWNMRLTPNGTFEVIGIPKTLIKCNCITCMKVAPNIPAAVTRGDDLVGAIYVMAMICRRDLGVPR